MKQDNFDEEKEKIKLSLNDEDESIQAFNGKSMIIIIIYVSYWVGS